jgi:hypothetical protein
MLKRMLASSKLPKLRQLCDSAPNQLYAGAEGRCWAAARAELALWEKASVIGIGPLANGDATLSGPIFSRWVSPWRARQIQGFALRAIPFCW